MCESWDLICELKGYVDACVDGHQCETMDTPFSTLENIQSRITVIHSLERPEVGSS